MITWMSHRPNPKNHDLCVNHTEDTSDKPCVWKITTVLSFVSTVECCLLYVKPEVCCVCGLNKHTETSNVSFRWVENPHCCHISATKHCWNKEMNSCLHSWEKRKQMVKICVCMGALSSELYGSDYNLKKTSHCHAQRSGMRHMKKT